MMLVAEVVACMVRAGKMGANEHEDQHLIDQSSWSRWVFVDGFLLLATGCCEADT